MTFHPLIRRALPCAAALVLAIPAFAVTVPADLNIIPWPAQITPGEGVFTLTTQTRVTADAPFAAEAAQLCAALSLPATGPGPGIAIKQSKQLQPEAYTLEITHSGVILTAATAAGAFYGCQTLRQLVSHQSMPCLRIDDAPRIAWRGFMLDVSRHFFDKHEVMTVLDQMATLKLNVFHWHLTDDNGWRIEIRKYPRLTTVGAWHPVTPLEQDSIHVKDGQYGGFYTQDDIREVVAYAAARHIRIVPEVDMPGHMSAAAAAYPELSPANGWTPLVARQDKTSGERCAALCVGRPKTLQFCRDVLEEIVTLFPSKEIHVGGDEVFYEQWAPCPDMQALKQKLGAKDWPEVQVAFGNDIAAFLTTKGRTAVFWNNIYRQSADKRGVNQFWRDMIPARDFANAGYDVLLSPYMYYFDHAQKLENAYRYDPLNIGTKPAAAQRLRGIEGCAWSERVATFSQLQKHIYPRLIAIAETGWTPQDKKDWTSFQRRLDHSPIPTNEPALPKKP